jgi:hypothetical protein
LIALIINAHPLGSGNARASLQTKRTFGH